MSETYIPLSELLKRRYVSDFIEKMAELGVTRDEVVQKATHVIYASLKEATTDMNGTTVLLDFMDSVDFGAYVRYHLKDQLDEVFGDDGVTYISSETT